MSNLYTKVCAQTVVPLAVHDRNAMLVEINALLVDLSLKTSRAVV